MPRADRSAPASRELGRPSAGWRGGGRAGGRPVGGRDAGGRRLVRRLAALLAVVALLGASCSTATEEEPGSAAPPDTGDAGPRLPGPSGWTDGEPDEEPAPDPPPEPAEPPPVPASREALIEEASSLLEHALEAADGEGFTALVVDEHGREVLAHDADEPVLPASTLKIVTAAVALTTFGPDATFPTTVEVTTSLDPDGALDGDLLLVGSGDPVLATEEYARWVYPARPRTSLEDLADAVVASGVTEVTGDLIGVSDRYDGPLVAEGWPDRYFADMDARYSSGLTVDAGLRTLLTYPEPEEDEDEGSDDEGSEDGDDGSSSDDDASDDDASDDDGSDDDGEGSGSDDEGSDDEGSDGRADEDEEDSDDRDEDGDGDEDPPPDVDPIVRVDHADDPAAHAATEFVRLLDDRGIEVHGEARSGTADAPVVGRLARVDSPPLVDLLRFAVQRSDNQMTDALFRASGRARTGVGSFDSGEQAARQVLERFDIDHDDARFADGSGLSRDDRVTARLLVDLDRAMTNSRHAATWSSLMAVTGRSGTLESRLAGTVADGRFAGKTGTLRDVTGLVGAVTGEGERRYHLAVVANDPGGARWIARTLTDELITVLVADLDGCAVGVSDGGDGVLGRPPVTVSC